MHSGSQFALLRQRRFLPFFVTQLLGAFNDNVFKQSLVLIILYRIGLGQDQSLLVNLCALLFILPFFLFSALGGQFGEKFAKDALIRALKLAEVVIMLAGAVAVWLGSLPLMLAVLFCMGTQSALFGPVKYSILPQHLGDDELVGGNALVEMGTFLAILAGTIGAGMLMSQDSYAGPVAVSVVLVALSGYLASRGIPRAHAALPELLLDWNILRQTWGILRLGLAEQHVSVSRSLLGNSWFWFLGATYLTQIPAYARDWLHGDESVVTLILMLFSVGIALGSLLCGRLSGRRLEPGLVPLGAFGLTLFGLLLFWHSGGFPDGGAPHDWLEVLSHAQAWWVLADILGLGVFGGLYIVPLYALIQARTAQSQRARVVAANNILNALLMVVSALVAILLLGSAGLSIAQLFLVVSLLNLLVSAYLFSAVPEFVVRFMVWLLGHCLYRIEHRGLEAIPREGPALLVCNHVSAVDALLIGGVVRRPVRFVIERRLYRSALLDFIFRSSGCIPIGEHDEGRTELDAAYRKIGECLDAGELVCIFPEGRPTGDGDIDAFRIELAPVLQRHPVPVIPMALQGLWGSLFSREPVRRWRCWRRKIRLVAGAPLAPATADGRLLQAQVAALRGDLR